MTDIYTPQQQVMANYSSNNGERIARILEENSRLIIAINEKGGNRCEESFELQKRLHHNLVYLTSMAYPNRSINEILNLIPSPKTAQESVSASILTDQQRLVAQYPAINQAIQFQLPQYQQHTFTNSLSSPYEHGQQLQSETSDEISSSLKNSNLYE